MKCLHTETQNSVLSTILGRFSLLVASIHFTLYFVFTITSHHEQFSSYSVCVHVCVRLCPKKTGILMDEYAITWNESVQIWISFFHETYTNQTCVVCFASLLHSFSPSRIYFSRCMRVFERACKCECVQVSRCVSPNDHRIFFILAATMSLNCNLNAHEFVLVMCLHVYVKQNFIHSLIPKKNKNSKSIDNCRYNGGSKNNTNNNSNIEEIENYKHKLNDDIRYF